ncbi:MAG: prolipoprotein diacylglyceryl transferase [Eubacteriaceae bacterium]|nr:prolipoprotein diacylglyceryl transferase [Eubacteriaceae bacterium]MDD4507418.1 prolipoprotein diacylglyceryl transferase [Eubacteriaceae bacterium]
MRAPDPIVFTLFGIDVRWYGILIAAALIIALVLALRRSRVYGISEDDITDFFLALIPAIIVGARAYYVIFEWDYYAVHPEEILAVWNGGLAIHGGIIAGILVGIIMCRVKHISFWTLADTVIPGLPLGQAIGRWGNFFNQEAHGVQTNLPWAIVVNDSKLGVIRVHPTFLYESIWDLMVFGLLLWYEKKGKRCDGEVFFLYLILYAAGRFWIEGLRTDSLMILGLRAAQVISIVMMVAGGIGLAWFRKKSRDQKMPCHGPDR